MKWGSKNGFAANISCDSSVFKPRSPIQPTVQWQFLTVASLCNLPSRSALIWSWLHHIVRMRKIWYMLLSITPTFKYECIILKLGLYRCLIMSKKIFVKNMLYATNLDINGLKIKLYVQKCYRKMGLIENVSIEWWGFILLQQIQLLNIKLKIRKIPNGSLKTRHIILDCFILNGPFIQIDTSFSFVSFLSKGIFVQMCEDLSIISWKHILLLGHTFMASKILTV